MIRLNVQLPVGGKRPNINTAKFAKNAKLSSNIFAGFAVRFTPAGLWTLILALRVASKMWQLFYIMVNDDIMRLDYDNC